MEPRTYTVDELMRLRHSHTSEASHGLPAKVRANPEFEEVVSKSDGTHSHALVSKKQKEVSSSSGGSEEAAYRGKKQSHQSHQSSQTGAGTQWRYRGRTGSEVGISDPISAPSGLNKQSSEGFQRFFKAVASPTHVRVTAGGRIVPNTRGSASPTTKWDKERAVTEAHHSIEPSKEIKVGPPNVHPNDQASAAAIPMVFHHQPTMHPPPGMPVSFHQPTHGPMQPGIPYGVATLPPQAANTSYISFSGGDIVANVAGDGIKQGGGDYNVNTGRVVAARILHPDQVDQNRPFYPNGQLMIPQAGIIQGQTTQGQVIPVIANPYMTTGVIAAPSYHGQPVAVNHAPSSMPIYNPNGHLSAPSFADQQNFTVSPPDANPHISSIRASEITRKQIEQLKASLKYYTGQLEFNRHQINERDVWGQCMSLRAQIDHFGRTLERQLRQEQQYIPSVELRPRQLHPSIEPNRQLLQIQLPLHAPTGPPSIRHTQASGSSNHGSVKSMGPDRGPKHFKPHQQQQNHHQKAGMGKRGGHRPNHAAVSINSTKTDNSTDYYDEFEAELIRRCSAPGATEKQKSVLEILTRPLNPSYDIKSSTVQQDSSDKDSSKGSSTGLVRAGQDKDLREQSSSSYTQHEREQPSGLYAKPERALEHDAQSRGVDTLRGNTSYMGIPNRNGSAIPYLVGNYPPGTDHWTYRGNEFMYSRALTDDEKQARSLYWGQISNHGTGLPKFDGKDFYPPSPQKSRGNKGGTRNAPARRPEVNFAFDARHAEVDPFRSSRDGNSICSYESSRKFSKAIPIVAPPGMDQKSSTSTMAETSKEKMSMGSGEGCKLPQNEYPEKNMEQKKSPKLDRRAVERSSAKSGQDFWQTMRKKGSTSGNVLPSAISSTTATGYLPQFAGNAIASLGPTISNGSPTRGSPTANDKLPELEAHRLTTEKIGENRPPSSACSTEHDATKELHQHMLRDAERRGVIGSDWQ